MRNLRLSLMLILMMVITPVMAAFGHYAEFAGQLSASTAVVAADQASDMDMSTMDMSSMDHGDHCQTHKAHQASCTSHVCVGCAITSSYRFFPVHHANSYRRSEKFTLISLAVSPDIKPPITVL